MSSEKIVKMGKYLKKKQISFIICENGKDIFFFAYNFSFLLTHDKIFSPIWLESSHGFKYIINSLGYIQKNSGLIFIIHYKIQ